MGVRDRDTLPAQGPHGPGDRPERRAPAEHEHLRVAAGVVHRQRRHLDPATLAARVRTKLVVVGRS